MMTSPSSELNLECKPTQGYSMLLKSFTDHKPQEQTTTHKLEDYLRSLEEERLKIDAFKRELPLCMQLLTHEMEISRQQLQSYKTNQGTRPVLEEFIPLKQSNSEILSHKKQTNTITDKANWMTSAQLWSQLGDGKKQQSPSTLPKPEVDIPKLISLDKQRNGGAFVPFSRDNLNSNSNDSSITSVLPKLGLGSGEGEMINYNNNKYRDQHENEINGSMVENLSTKIGINNRVVLSKVVEDTQATTTTSTSTTQTTNRKARRCWSPDLHRRFVNALQVLGGSQVATPKQIRELMKVDGLTNDEVKSHLQKYRLHTRRPGPSPQVSPSPTPQLVVLGGIWVPPEYGAAHGGAPHYCSPLDHHFYPPPPPPPQLTHPHVHQPSSMHHHQVQVYKSCSRTQSHNSPESESIEDGKSESSSWNKDESKMASLREINGSEITLKF